VFAIRHCDAPPGTGDSPPPCTCLLEEQGTELVPTWAGGRTVLLVRPWWYCPECYESLSYFDGRLVRCRPDRNGGRP
jgi:hypothetical protein